MGWSLEIYTRRDSQILQQELAAVLLDVAPQLEIVAAPPKDGAVREGNDWASLALLERGNSDQPQATVSLLDFRAEYEADSKLLDVLTDEISQSDAQGVDVDEDYSQRLVSLLHEARKHYIVTSAQLDSAEQERTVIRATYAISQIAGGLIHDLQSGAWMDPSLFEDLLDAYGVTDSV